MADAWAQFKDADPWAGFQDAEPPKPKAAPPKQKPSTYADIINSAASGLAEGAAGAVGMAGDIGDLMGAGMRKLGIQTRDQSKPLSDELMAYPGGMTGAVSNGPKSADMNEAIQSVAGKYPESQTIPGQYARTITSFLPGALFPGSNVRRAANVVIPALTSETAGQVFKGDDLEPYARFVGAAAGGFAAGPAVRSINAVTSRLGAPIVNPQTAANELMAGAIQRDGGAQNVQTNLDNYRGISAPALIDVTGNNVRRLVRSAASGGSGEAQNVALGYEERIAGNLQDNATGLTRNLTPTTQKGATRYGEELAKAQELDADTKYKGPYSQPAQVTPEMVDALQGPEGRGAINRAYAAARSRRNLQQKGELKDLQAVATEQGATADPLTGRKRTLQQALEGVSAGSLDRVRIAMRETGRALSAKGANDIAGGYFGRMKDIDTALDQTPGLQDARASYKGYATQQEALDLGQTGLNASPETYAANIADLAARSPQVATNTRTAAGVGYRQALTDAIQRPAEGATGVLNRISTSNAQGQNLEATFGPNAARDYQTGVGNEVDRLKNARFINPNTGSQTALRIQEAGLVDIPTSGVGIVARIFDTIRRGGALTDQERTALVKLGTTEAKLVNLAHQNPSLTSRALGTALIGTGGRRQ
jgi:hypothetical protein